MWETYIDQIRKTSPLVHAITNYVTVNDVANIILAIGGQPIMADDAQEVEEITSICQSLVINIGTLNARTVESMILAGKAANRLGHPVILDPVGLGASSLRQEAVKRLLQEVKFTVIRGNISEIKMLMHYQEEMVREQPERMLIHHQEDMHMRKVNEVAVFNSTSRGVDASPVDQVREDNLSETLAFMKAAASSLDAIVISTGAIDLIANAEQCYIIRNGHPMMARVTGTGCQLSGLLGAFMGALSVAEGMVFAETPEDQLVQEGCAHVVGGVSTEDTHVSPLRAAAAAVATMGLAGQIGYENLAAFEGNSTYRNRIIDAVFHMTGDQLEKGINIDRL